VAVDAEFRRAISRIISVGTSVRPKCRTLPCGVVEVV
jgi:hypothetical protein